MTKLQRIKEICIGLIIIFGALIMMFFPKESYVLIVMILALWFAFRGLGSIWYYITMARYMVGGRESLFMGVIWFDFGVITGSLTGVPHYYVLLYLIAIHGFSGVVRILRTLEARRNGSSNWKLKLAHGIIDIAMAMNSKSDDGEYNSTIKKINFSRNSISNPGLISFCTILKYEPENRFTKINMQYNYINNLSINNFGEFIQNYPEQTFLSLTHYINNNNQVNYFKYCQNFKKLKKIMIQNLVFEENTSILFNKILLTFLIKNI